MSHEHLDRVQLPDETVIWAVSFPSQGYQRHQEPDFGLYLDQRWQPPWPHRHVDWPDFGLPADRRALAESLGGFITRAQAGAMVEVGCLGGHGRTGTAIARLAVLAGLTEDPVDWVRANYCHQAIETEEQAAFARAWAV